MIRFRNVALALVALLLAGGLTACGSSSSSTGASSSGSSSATGGNNVMIKGFAFSPSTLTVKVGAKVTFTQEDSGTMHTATSTGGKTINSPKMKQGQSYTVTFTKAGTYPYICSIHPFMKGTIIVK
jgi:plastocyanin